MARKPRPRPVTWKELVASYARVKEDLDLLTGRARIRREVAEELRRIAKVMSDMLERIRG